MQPRSPPASTSIVMSINYGGKVMRIMIATVHIEITDDNEGEVGTE